MPLGGIQYIHVLQPPPLSTMFQNIFVSSKETSGAVKQAPCPIPHAPVLSPHSHSSALSLWLHLSGAFHIKTIMQCVWLLSLSILFSRFIDFIACVSSSFLYTAEYYSTVCIYYILLSIQNVSE